MRSRREAVLTAAAVTGALLAAIPSQAAEPSEGTIRWGETVEWSGGPLTGTGRIGDIIGDTGFCVEEGCDDFLLDVQVGPSPNPKRVRFVEVRVEDTDQEPIALGSGDVTDLVVFPPDADPSRDFTFHDADAARLLDPEPGVWRIQVRCVVNEPCVDITYTARATTGQVRVPRTVVHHADGVRTTSPRLRAISPDVRFQRVGATAFEPTLGITEDGSVYYQALTTNQIPKVLRSDDDGATWENVSPRLGPLYRHPTSNDPLIHVDEETGRVFTVDYQLHTALCSELSFTDDGGKNWTTTQVCGHTDHQNLFTGPPVSSPTVGYPNVVYFCAINGGAMTSFGALTTCAKSLDGGITFAYTGTPPYHDDPRQSDGHFGIPGKCGGETSHGVAGPDGTIYIPRGYCGQPYLAISRDEGLTWTRVQVADNGMPRTRGDQLEHESGVAVDDEGNLYYVWGAEDRLPYLAISRDGGETWSKPMMIGAPSVTEASFPAIDVGAPGRIAVMYMGTENSPGAPFDGEYTATNWNGYMMMTTTALARKPVFFTATVNDPADPLIVGPCGPLRCEDAGDFFDVVIAPDGTPWAAFVDACAGDRCSPFGVSEDGLVGHLVGGPPLVAAKPSR